MTATANWARRAITKRRNSVTSIPLKASAAIAVNDCLIVTGSGTVGPCGEGDTEYAGFSMDPIASGGGVEVVSAGPVVARAGAIVTAGDQLKCWTSGSVAPFVDVNTSGDTIYTTGAGAAFTNQPANDGIEIVSSSASDTQDIVIVGTTTATDTVVVETIAATGTSQADTIKTDWGQVLAVYTAVTPVGTITLREASGNATITTLTPTVLSRGREAVTNVYAGNVIPKVTASGATTKQIGLEGTDSAGAALYDSQALTGATAAAMNSSFRTITYVLTGDLEASRTVTVTIGAEETNYGKIVGKALESAAAVGDTFLVKAR